jgi:hypothetical protein
MLVDAVGRRDGNEAIDADTGRHGSAGLATVLTYAVARERGETAHQLIVRDLDISPLEAEVILGALRPVVHDHVGVEVEGVGAETVQGTNDS